MTRMPAPYKSNCMADWTSSGYNVTNSHYSLSVSVTFYKNNTNNNALNLDWLRIVDNNVILQSKSD